MKAKTTRLAMLAVVAALASAQTVRAITYGELDNGRHPNVGAVMVKIPGSTEPLMFMTGTLIQSNLFLTAGHGTSEIELAVAVGIVTVSDVYVTFSDDPYDESTYIPVTAVLTHPGYKPAKWSVSPVVYADAHGMGSIPIEDVGLLVLAEPSNIIPAALPPVGFLDELKAAKALERDTVFLAVGYGSRATFPIPKPVFEKHSREMVASEYLNFNQRWLNLSMNSVLGNGGGGYGDSGGPRFWIDPVDGSEHLVSITSRGDINLVTIDVTYRIDTPAALDFIHEVMELLEEANVSSSAQKLLASDPTAGRGQAKLWPNGTQLMVQYGYTTIGPGWVVDVQWPVAPQADHYRLTVIQNTGKRATVLEDVSPVNNSTVWWRFYVAYGSTYTVILTAYSDPDEATAHSESLQARITIK